MVLNPTGVPPPKKFDVWKNFISYNELIKWNKANKTEIINNKKLLIITVDLDDSVTILLLQTHENARLKCKGNTVTLKLGQGKYPGKISQKFPLKTKARVEAVKNNTYEAQTTEGSSILKLRWTEVRLESWVKSFL